VIGRASIAGESRWPYSSHWQAITLATTAMITSKTDESCFDGGRDTFYPKGTPKRDEKAKRANAVCYNGSSASYLLGLKRE
jgi:hypothetical protein